MNQHRTACTSFSEVRRTVGTLSPAPTCRHSERHRAGDETTPTCAAAKHCKTKFKMPVIDLHSAVSARVALIAARSSLGGAEVPGMLAHALGGSERVAAELV